MKTLILSFILMFILASCSVVQIIDPCSGKKFPKKQWCKFTEKFKKTKDGMH